MRDPQFRPSQVNQEKLGPEEQRFFTSNVKVCDWPMANEAAYREINEMIAAMDREFLALPPKNR